MFALPPLAGLAAVRPRARRPVAGLLLAAPMAEWARAWRAGRTAGLDPVRWAVCRLADDVAYGSGVWAGAVRSREPRAVLPTVVRDRAGAAPGGGRTGARDGRTDDRDVTGHAPGPARTAT
ncbi:unannotated protein [freshwater metagenome]|uniref:Unannotated protein n=1 Tax=freshwater metagenome TaxID=449393 RepID=A0A6J7JBX1_9ZZZZ